MAQSEANKLATVKDVCIDESGRFMYVLIRVSVDNESKYIVRGYDCEGKFHSEIYNNEKTCLAQSGIESECAGGGRIDHNNQKKMILVYGTSQEYSRGDHELVVDLLKANFPDYRSIRYTNEGY